MYICICIYLLVNVLTYKKMLITCIAVYNAYINGYAIENTLFDGCLYVNL